MGCKEFPRKKLGLTTHMKKIPKGMQEISDRKVMPDNPYEKNPKRDI
jgi:hypothetical protein